jgi:hypothetical protein
MLLSENTRLNYDSCGDEVRHCLLIASVLAIVFWRYVLVSLFVGELGLSSAGLTDVIDQDWSFLFTLFGLEHPIWHSTKDSFPLLSRKEVKACR